MRISLTPTELHYILGHVTNDLDKFQETLEAPFPRGGFTNDGLLDLQGKLVAAQDKEGRE